MSGIIKQITLFVFTAFLVFAWNVSLTLAATRIDPDAVDIAITPGTPHIQQIWIMNEGDQSVKYTLSIWGIEFGETADELQFVPIDEAEAGWFSLSSSEIEIAPQSESEIGVTISVPAEAVGGTRTYAIVAQEQGQKGIPGVSVRTGLASLFFVTIGEGKMAELKIEAFEALPKQTTFLPVRFAALLTNNGEGNIQPAGQIVIRNFFGKIVAVLPLSEVPRRLPAKTSRVFAVTWGEEPKEKGLVAEFRNFHLGPYSAQLEVLGTDEQTLTQNTRVVLFPWRTVALSVGLLALGSFIFWRKQRRSSR